MHVFLGVQAVLCFGFSTDGSLWLPAVHWTMVGLNFDLQSCMKKNPILIVDDDTDDIMLIKAAAEHLNLDMPIEFFTTGQELYDRLINETKVPFLIICDVNLPKETGFDIKRRLSEDPVLKYKSVPFIFWSTDASEKQIQYAYDLPAQGFFFKPSDFTGLCDIFQTIIDYWKKSQHPKSVL